MSAMSRPRVVAVSLATFCACLVLNAWIQVTHPVGDRTTVVGFVEHLSLFNLTVATFALMPMLLFMGERAGATRLARIGCVGLGGLGLLAASSGVKGDDFGFFPFVAIPTNLMWLAAVVVLAVRLYRRGELGRGYAIALGFTWFLTLPGSHFGGAAIAAVIWIAVAARLGVWRDGLASDPVPATA